MEPIEQLLAGLHTAEPGADLDRDMERLFQRQVARRRRGQRIRGGLALALSLGLGVGVGFGWGRSTVPEPTVQEYRSVTYVLPVTDRDDLPFLDLTEADPSWLAGPETTVTVRDATSL